jgi:hypothetical protein
VYRHKKNLKDYKESQGLICKIAITHLLPQISHGRRTGSYWPTVAPTTRATRSTEEAWNRKRRTRGPCRRAHPRRTARESAGFRRSTFAGGKACGSGSSSSRRRREVSSCAGRRRRRAGRAARACARGDGLLLWGHARKRRPA